MRPILLSVATPSGKVSIRPGVPGDAVSMSELRMEALRDNPTAFGSSYEARENCTPEWALRVLSADPQEGLNFLADLDGRLVGMAGIRRNTGSKRRHGATIGGVFVQPAWRGMGIADALMRACLKWAKQRHIGIIKLGVMTNNLPALKVYQRLGFTIYGHEPKLIMHEGVYYGEYLMALDLEKDGKDGS